MPTLLQLILTKNKRLESVPDAFLSGIDKVQKQLSKDVISLLSMFDQDAEGRFILNDKNLKLAQEVDLKLRESLQSSEYGEFVTQFAREFNTQVEFNDEYFKAAFPKFGTSELGKQIVSNAQTNAVNLLINTSPDAKFILPIKEQIELAITNNAGFDETITNLLLITTGDGVVDGKIMQYSKQIAHDSFALSDRGYSSIVATEMDAEWFFYSGSEIKTTRAFCAERDGQYFCLKEIEMWGMGLKTEGMKWPQNGEWDGEMTGTNSATIFSTAGGYNCRHSIMAVSVFKVPLEVVKKAVERGYYEPSEYVINRLGLAA